MVQWQLFRPLATEDRPIDLTLSINIVSVSMTVVVYSLIEVMPRLREMSLRPASAPSRSMSSHVPGFVPGQSRFQHQYNGRFMRGLTGRAVGPQVSDCRQWRLEKLRGLHVQFQQFFDVVSTVRSPAGTTVHDRGNQNNRCAT